MAWQTAAFCTVHATVNLPTNLTISASHTVSAAGHCSGQSQACHLCRYLVAFALQQGCQAAGQPEQQQQLPEAQWASDALAYLQVIGRVFTCTGACRSSRKLPQQYVQVSDSEMQLAPDWVRRLFSEVLSTQSPGKEPLLLHLTDGQLNRIRHACDKGGRFELGELCSILQSANPCLALRARGGSSGTVTPIVTQQQQPELEPAVTLWVTAVCRMLCGLEHSNSNSQPVVAISSSSSTAPGGSGSTAVSAVLIAAVSAAVKAAAMFVMRHTEDHAPIGSTCRAGQLPPCADVKAAVDKAMLEDSKRAVPPGLLCKLRTAFRVAAAKVMAGFEHTAAIRAAAKEAVMAKPPKRPYGRYSAATTVLAATWAADVTANKLSTVAQLAQSASLEVPIPKVWLCSKPSKYPEVCIACGCS